MSREINWGPDAATAKYKTEDTGTPGDFVVAEDTDGNTVLLKYDDTAGEWVYGGPVNMGGSDISDVGQLSSTSVSTEKQSIGELATIVDAGARSSNQTVADEDETLVEWTTIVMEDAAVIDADLSQDSFIVQSDGLYFVDADIYWDSSNDWTTGDFAQIRIRVNGTTRIDPVTNKAGTGRETKSAFGVVNLTAGDEITIAAFQNSGVSQEIANTGFGSDDRMRLEIVKLG